MSLMRNDVVALRPQTTFCYQPSSLDEALKYASIIANTGLCPDSFRGKTNDVLVAIQMGAELGLKPLQALRCIGVVNGRPFIWGDGLLYLVKKQSSFKDCKEWLEGSIADKNLTAYCTIYLHNQTEVTRKFSMADAIAAGLWMKTNKNGSASVWKLYPERMLQMRARGFACRDACPGAFFNLYTEDEVINIDNGSKLLPAKGIKSLEEKLNIESDDTKVLIDELNSLMFLTDTTEDVKQKWLDKANVDDINQLNTEQLNKIINFLKSKLEKK